jgi:hypothetical protein
LRFAISNIKAFTFTKIKIEGKFESLADIARKEKVGTSYVSKVFNLNFCKNHYIQISSDKEPALTMRLSLVFRQQLKIPLPKQTLFFYVKNP